MRPSGRTNDALRDVEIETGFNRHAEGSCLIRVGHTHVICTATVEERVPPFRRNSGQGWVTAEYGMLPRATNSRMRREAKAAQSGRTQEIQRLIGRSLRAGVDFHALGERQITIDCDVIQADGGTRTASITGACVALIDALTYMRNKGIIKANPLKHMIAALSVGIYEGTPIADLEYIEDSAAETDMNVVMTETGKLIEVQGTAEGEPFSFEEMHELLEIAKHGLRELFDIQKAALN